MDSNKMLISPLEYMDIDNQLEINDMVKNYIPDTILKANSVVHVT